MDRPETFEVQGDIAFFRPTGVNAPMWDVIQKVTQSIVYTREQGIGKLLVDTLGLTGDEPTPTLIAQFFIAREGAVAADRKVHLVVVAEPKHIDPEKRGVAIAAEYRLVCDAFPSEAEAFAWLNDRGE